MAEEPQGLELIGGREPRPVVIMDYDPAWPARFEIERTRISAALPDVRRIEHIGSTSVPGLAAKPIVDIVVEPAEPIEGALAPLETAGYQLRVREPGHRMLRTPERDVHIHLWADLEQIERHLVFRDWLRVDAADRDRYVAVKRELARRDWPDVNGYADAKTDVVTEILARAEAWAESKPDR